MVSSLPAKKRRRPPLIGEKCDSYLRELIEVMRSRGAPIGSNIVISLGRGVLLRYDKSSLEEFGATIHLSKDCASENRLFQENQFKI